MFHPEFIRFRVRPMLQGGITAAIAAAACTTLHGIYSLPNYKLWQPFEGGTGFVIMQVTHFDIITLIRYGIVRYTSSHRHKGGLYLASL